MKFKHLLAIISYLILISCNNNVTYSTNNISHNHKTDTINYAKRHLLDKEPYFQGGDVNKFTGWTLDQLENLKNFKYPEHDGVIYIEFIVTSKGTLSDVKIVKSDFPEIEDKLLNIINSSPLWEPAVMNGKNVNVVILYAFLYQI